MTFQPLLCRPGRTDWTLITVPSSIKDFFFFFLLCHTSSIWQRSISYNFPLSLLSLHSWSSCCTNRPARYSSIYCLSSSLLTNRSACFSPPSREIILHLPAYHGKLSCIYQSACSHGTAESSTELCFFPPCSCKSLFRELGRKYYRSV